MYYISGKCEKCGAESGEKGIMIVSEKSTKFQFEHPWENRYKRKWFCPKHIPPNTDQRYLIEKEKRIMGMIDWVDFEMDCPECGLEITNWQTKDKDCLADTVPVNGLYSFNGLCKCHALIEFRLPPGKTINDFVMTVIK